MFLARPGAGAGTQRANSASGPTGANDHSPAPHPQHEGTTVHSPHRAALDDNPTWVYKGCVMAGAPRPLHARAGAGNLRESGRDEALPIHHRRRPPRLGRHRRHRDRRPLRRQCRRRTGAALEAIGPGWLQAMVGDAPRLPLDEARLRAPATPRKYLAIALNYAEHIEETGMERPRFRPSSTSRSPASPGQARRPHAAGLHLPRLRGRAGGGDRPALPPRAAPSGRTRSSPATPAQTTSACATGRATRRR